MHQHAVEIGDNVWKDNCYESGIDVEKETYPVEFKSVSTVLRVKAAVEMAIYWLRTTGLRSDWYVSWPANAADL